MEMSNGVLCLCALTHQVADDTYDDHKQIKIYPINTQREKLDALNYHLIDDIKAKEKRIKLIFITQLEIFSLIIMLFIMSGQCQTDRTQLIDILLKRRE